MLPGWTQRAQSSEDSFWTWREAMYTAAAGLGHEELEAIAARCYLDLLRGGYTGVAEFLYLHRLHKTVNADLDADRAIAAAAARTGIGLTLLPTLYQHSDFGGAPPTGVQNLFARSTEQFLSDWSELKRRYATQMAVRLGVAFHSLRAVDIEIIVTLCKALQNDPACAVLHMHVAEQAQEVEACLRRHKRTPLALLAERGVLNEFWALVHATHTTRAELDLLLEANAVLVLCPTTEADLGDGCMDVPYFLDRGGRLAIGSDSNIGCHALVELRQLEWSLRLARGRRNVLASATQPVVADRLYGAVLNGGWAALGDFTSRYSAPIRADFVTYGAEASDWEQHPPENYLSTLVFGAAAPAAQQVMVGGRWAIRNGVHEHEAEIDERYRAALQRLQPPLLRALKTQPR